MYENRTNGGEIGTYGSQLFLKIFKRKYKIGISDFIVKELMRYYSLEEVDSILRPFSKLIVKIHTNEEQVLEAKNTSKELKVPFGDVLHAILARDNELILVSRDKHFRRLRHITHCWKPEDLTHIL